MEMRESGKKEIEMRVLADTVVREYCERSPPKELGGFYGIFEQTSWWQSGNDGIDMDHSGEG